MEAVLDNAPGVAMPPQMRAMLRGLGPGWPLTAWILLRVRGCSRAAIRAALAEVLASDPVFRLTLVPPSADTGLDAWTLESRPSAPVPLVVDLMRIGPSRAAHAVGRIAGRITVAGARALATTAVVVATGEGEHQVLVALPAPCADRRTLHLAARRFARALASPGEPDASWSSAPDYLRFLEWQRTFLLDPKNRPHRDLWTRRLGGNGRPHSHERGDRRDTGARRRIASCSRSLDAMLAGAVDAAAREGHGSPAAVFGSAWRVHAASELAERPDTIGWEISGRFTGRLETALGSYARHVPVRTQASPADSFTAVLAESERELAFALEHEEYYDTGVDTETAPSAYAFDCAFAFDDERLEDAPVVVLDHGCHPIRFRLRLRVRRLRAGYDVALDYDATVYPRWHADLLLTRYVGTLRACLATPGARLSQVRSVSARERHCLLTEWNDAAGDPPAPELVPDRIRAVCSRYADRAALVCREGVWTYGTLQRRVAAVERRLSRKQIGRGARVVLLLERSPEAIAAMLGTLEAGAAYVPVSPDQPAERIASIVADCRPAAVITASRAQRAVPPFRGEIVLVDDLDAEAVAPREPSADGPAPDDPAYILYTSGSTGTPKGVVITHANLARSLAARRATYRATEPGFFLASPLVFDSSVAGIYWTLAVGGRLCLPPDRIHDRFDEALDLLRAGRVTHALFLPSLYRVILERAAAPVLENFQTIILAGEDVAPDVVALHRLRTTGVALVNEYGLTEASVWSTAYRVPPGRPPGRIPIGRAVPGARVYVLGDDLEVCPAGREGDLYLGGPMISPGYWNLPGETAGKFVPDPFAHTAGARMCRTGDRARWRTDGNLEFLGRSDHQVKIRGVRVELAEIEHLLARQPWIADAAATAAPNGGGELRIQTFVVARSPDDTRVRELEGVFRSALPPQLLPIPVTLLPALPRTASGKVDRARLVPKTSRATVPSPIQAPGESPVRELIANLWCAQLGIGTIADADSFWELGGNSIKAIPLIAGLQRVFGMDLGLRELFETPTLGGLTRRVESAMRAGRSGDLRAAGPVRTNARAPLSFAQRRLWFLETLQPGRTAYHCPIAIRVEGAFPILAWEQTLSEIARLQESMRTVIRRDADRAELEVRPPAPARCGCVDLSGLAPEHQDRVWRRLSRAEAVRAFSLEQEPAWRQRVVRFGARGAAVLLNFHHIACDLWSMEILIGDINALYPLLARGSAHGRRPPERTYSDFSRWQHAWLSDERGAALVERWRDVLGPSRALAEIPTDFPRLRTTTGRGCRLEFSLGAGVSARVADIAREEQATPFLVLLAACHAMVACSSGGRDTCVGVPVANRAWPGGEEIVGLMLNTLPIPARVSPASDFRGLLGRVRETFLTAFAIQDLPFERIVEALGFARDPGRNPVFQVFFTYRSRLAANLRLPAADVRFDQIDTGAAKFDLTLNVAETDRGFEVVLEYDRDLFAPASVARLAHLYRHLVATLCREPAAKLERTRLLPPHQRQQLIAEWNDTGRDWGSEPSLHELFRDAARRAPDRVALVDGSARFTFAALDAWSDAIAAGLERLGLAAGEAVGVWLPRSANAVAAMLGALKAGLAFVPLDPEAPLVRLRQAAEDAGMRVVVSDRLGGADRQDVPFRVVHVGQLLAETTASIADDRRSGVAYILFTSGSTGRPKGVRGSHRAIVNRFRWMWDRHPVGMGEVFCSKAPLTFVDSLWEVFGGLLQGAPLVVLPDAIARDPRALTAALRAHDVSRIVFIPSFLRLLLESVPDAFRALPSLRHVTVSGEPLEPSVCRLFHRSPGRAELLNLYGMTEAAADVTWHVPHGASDLGEPVPIGRPLANVRTYVLDRGLEPVAVGVPAELYVGGEALADGYAADPAATAARFVPHPFAAAPGERLYRTGDLCAWQADGRLRYLGRCDRQLKVRGMRVEPAEVEERLRAHPMVADAVVVGLPSAAGTRLVAYLVGRERSETVRVLTAEERGDVRRFLAATLPSHMIPSELVVVPAFPRTASGKVDSRALPSPEQAGVVSRASEDTPASELERGIQRIWKTVLRRDAVPLDANFFDVGGNSFHLIQVQNRLRTDLDLDVEIFDMFAHPSVKDFAAFVAGARDETQRVRALSERVSNRRAALAAPPTPRTRSWK